jgi:hypothetical protein
MPNVEIEFDERPSVATYMLRALYPGFLRESPPFPPLRARWRASRPDLARLGQFLRLTGLKAKRGVPILYPQVFTFPLQMVILTHPALPLPIWGVLQVRNHLLQHRAISVDSAFDAAASVVGQRTLEKGFELDIHVSVRVKDEIVWEGLTTYYYRGSFGEPGPASPVATAPPGAGTEVARWRTDLGGGFGFSAVSGDYNGIHYWSRYARLLGFRGALHHPHVLVGQCLAHLTELAEPAQRLDLWLKGPVYYGSEVSLAAGTEGSGVTFALTPAGSGRPALSGRWRELQRGEPALAPTGASP